MCRTATTIPRHTSGGTCDPPLAVVGEALAERHRVKVTGLAQKLGQLEAVNRDLQSKSWANLKLLGQPCNLRAWAPVVRQDIEMVRADAAAPESDHACTVEFEPEPEGEIHRVDPDFGPTLTVSSRDSQSNR